MKPQFLSIVLISAGWMLSSCQVNVTNPSPSPGATVSPTPAATSSPIITPTPTPVVTAQPAGRQLIRFVRRSIDWGSLNEAEKSRNVVQDFDNRRVVHRSRLDEDIARGGEVEFTWSEPPQVIALDQSVTLNINGKINVAAELGTGNTFSVSTLPAAFFESDPDAVIKQNVGRFSDGKLDQGSKQITLKPVGITNTGFDENTDIVIQFYISNSGPSINYHYRLER